MICKKCRNAKHYKCKNGPWAIGTWCACQHRVKISPGIEIALANKYGRMVDSFQRRGKGTQWPFEPTTIVTGTSHQLVFPSGWGQLVNAPNEPSATSNPEEPPATVDTAHANSWSPSKDRTTPESRATE